MSQSLYKRVSGIQASPLYNQHLQPSEPPPSATQEQLCLFERILERRSSQLSVLSPSTLETTYDILAEARPDNPLASEIQSLLHQLPSKQPTNQNQYISIIRYLLIGNFHNSVDSRLKQQERTQALAKVKSILQHLDLAYSDYSSELAKKKEKEDAERAKKVQERLRQQKAKEAKEKEKQKEQLRALYQHNHKEPSAALGVNTEESNTTPAEATASNSASALASRIAQLASRIAENTTAVAATETATPTANSETALKTIKAKQEMGAVLTRPQPEAPGAAAEDAIVILSDSDEELDTDANVLNKKKNAKNATETDDSTKAKDATVASAPSSNDTTVPKTGAETVSAPDGGDNEETNLLKDEAQEAEFKKYLALAEAKLKSAGTKISSTKEGAKPPSSPSSTGSSASSSSTPPGRKRLPPFSRLQMTPTLSKLSRRTLNVCFNPDTKHTGSFTSSSSIIEDRNYRQLVFSGCYDADLSRGMYIDGPTLDDVQERFAKWDPYWKVIHDLSILDINGYEVGFKTAPILSGSSSSSDSPKSALQISAHLWDHMHLLDAGTKFGKSDKEKRLLLRALPIKVPEKYKKMRSDTHLWPKGTFVQMNGRTIALTQRKQQSHEHTLWKGMCQMFDITSELEGTSTSKGLNLDVCTKDKDGYYFQLAICEFSPPEVLFERCIGEGQGAITKLSFEEGRALVQQNLDQKDAVVLDDSDDEDDDKGTTDTLDASNVYLTCSLLCGVSMSAIQTPVRGKNCKHMQCFDLKNYLLNNSVVSGGRWRCVVCEDFVPVQDLVIDGFVSKILDVHGKDVNTSRDKVTVYRNGTWKFLNENKLRYQKKRQASNSDLPGSKRSKPEKSAPSEAVVIDILDDDDE